MAKTEYKKLIIPSLFKEAQQIEPYLQELQEQAGFNDEDLARIMLTLSEAVTNAIVHGNKEDPKKEVVISSCLDDNILSISVKDEGDGFNPADLPSPLKEENLLNEGGRGVYLIRQYTDGLSFSENGTRLVMEFELKQP